MSKIYTVVFMNADMAVLDFKLFGSYKAALKEFLKEAILETKEKFAEVIADKDEDENDSEFDVTSDSETDDSDYEEEEEDDDETTCILQIHELSQLSGGKSSEEYELKIEYDVESFQEFLDEKEDAFDYMSQLEKDLVEPGFILSDEILESFPC